MPPDLTAQTTAYRSQQSKQKQLSKKKLLKPSAINQTPFSASFLSSEFLFRYESSVDFVIVLHTSFYYFSLEHSKEYA